VVVAPSPREDESVARLTSDDLRRFGRDGYLLIPKAVAEPLLASADIEIDRLVDDVAPDEGDGGPGPNLWFRPRSELPRCEVVLRQSGALDIAEELVVPRPLGLGFDQI
jgi:hypothetical protein